MKLGALAAVALSLALSACAVAPTPEQLEISRQAEPPLAPAGILTIVDERNPGERKTQDLGVVYMLPGGMTTTGQSITGAIGCDGGVSILGEEVGNGSSDRLARLERDLVAAVGDSIRGEKLIVRRYAIFSNGEAIINSGNKEAFETRAKRGVTIAPRCPRAEMRGGWFDPADLDNNFPPVTVEITVNFRGADYSAIAAHSPPILQHWNHWVLPVISQAAMKKANARLIAAIQKN